MYRNLSPFFDEARAALASILFPTVPTYRDPWAGNPDTDKHVAHDERQFRNWVEWEIASGNLSPAARGMARSEVIWQWEQYTGGTYRH